MIYITACVFCHHLCCPYLKTWGWSMHKKANFSFLGRPQTTPHTPKKTKQISFSGVLWFYLSHKKVCRWPTLLIGKWVGPEVHCELALSAGSIDPIQSMWWCQPGWAWIGSDGVRRMVFAVGGWGIHSGKLHVSKSPKDRVGLVINGL